MIQKFLCWFFGHKTVLKAYTGQTLTADTTFEKDVKHPLYKYERSKFCIRCGVMVHKD